VARFRFSRQSRRGQEAFVIFVVVILVLVVLATLATIWYLPSPSDNEVPVTAVSALPDGPNCGAASPQPPLCAG